MGSILHYLCTQHTAFSILCSVRGSDSRNIKHLSPHHRRLLWTRLTATHLSIRTPYSSIEKICQQITLPLTATIDHTVSQQIILHDTWHMTLGTHRSSLIPNHQYFPPTQICMMWVVGLGVEHLLSPPSNVYLYLPNSVIPIDSP
jgi:hypothetical protein